MAKLFLLNIPWVIFRLYPVIRVFAAGFQKGWLLSNILSILEAWFTVKFFLDFSKNFNLDVRKLEKTDFYFWSKIQRTKTHFSYCSKNVFFRKSYIFWLGRVKSHFLWESPQKLRLQKLIANNTKAKILSHMAFWRKLHLDQSLRRF